jgi:hypothetical protein
MMQNQIADNPSYILQSHAPYFSNMFSLLLTFWLRLISNIFTLNLKYLFHIKVKYISKGQMILKGIFAKLFPSFFGIDPVVFGRASLVSADPFRPIFILYVFYVIIVIVFYYYILLYKCLFGKGC